MTLPSHAGVPLAMGGWMPESSGLCFLSGSLFPYESNIEIMASPCQAAFFGIVL